MLFLLNRPIIGSGFFMPFLVGTIGGYVFGYLYNQRKVKQKYLYDAIEQQKILNSILILSNQEASLQGILDKTIHYIIKAPFCKLQSKGAIFTKEGNNRLILKSHHNLSPQLLNKCGQEGVGFGECLCGLAAEKKETIFKNCVDHDHTVRFDDMEGHGHYNVPILYNDEVLGVIVVYLNEHHKKNETEIDFLESVANVLAIILNKKTVDQKVLKSESKLREIQDFGGIGTWTLNVASSVIKSSDEVYSIMGYEPQSFAYTEEDFLMTTIEEDRPTARNALEKAKKGESFELELRHYHKNGSIVHIINKCKPKVLENGYNSELTGTIIDITKLRFKEAELVEKQEIVNGILRATPDPLFLIDLDTNDFLYYNEAMENVLIENPRFIIDYPKNGARLFRDAVHPDDLEKYDKMNKELRSAKDFYDITFRTNIFGGSYHWVEQRVLIFVRGSRGKVQQVLIVSKDITEKVAAENKISTLNNELQTQFNDIKKVNKELDQFVYSVSHDLRAPLASMLGLVNLCHNDPSVELLRECMNRMGSSIEKLDSFIKDILDYSRNSRTEVDSEVFVIKELVEELVDNIKLLGDPDIKLELTTDEQFPYLGDRRRISIVLNNLISNACKYADKTKEKRFIKIDIVTTNNGCNLKIEDNGIGINPERMDKVFEMFYRGTEESDGSGLGLYIVRETIHKLEGTVNLDSTEGVGTKIDIKIPHAKSAKVISSEA